MTYKFRFKPTGEKYFNKLPRDVQERIVKKLEYFENSGDPLEFSERLINYELGEYRFRVGNYRIITEISDGTIFILLVGHRRDIYKK